MKRSEINQAIQQAEIFFRERHFALPPFAAWTPEELRRRRQDCREIFDCGLGWDITDFGHGKFRHEGLLLFTLRNGVLDNSSYPKPYAEKIMIVRESQLTLMHCHLRKTEDIINRGGGDLSFKLYRQSGTCNLDETHPVVLTQDGTVREIPPGGRVTLAPGESITLTPGIFHAFQGGEGTGDVLVGEVSSVNDDHTDNVFYGSQLRFPPIEEDEAPYRLLVKDYESLTR